MILYNFIKVTVSAYEYIFKEDESLSALTA